MLTHHIVQNSVYTDFNAKQYPTTAPCLKYTINKTKRARGPVVLVFYFKLFPHLCFCLSEEVSENRLLLELEE